MKNCVVTFNNERTEFINKDGLVTITQYEDGEKVMEFSMPGNMAEDLKKTLLEDSGAEEKSL